MPLRFVPGTRENLCVLRWRVRIDHLESRHGRGVNYYHPQTDAWVPELIRLENNAIEKATHLLFVMSPRVRGLTTFVEIAHYIGKCPDRVIVVDLWRRSMADRQRRRRTSREPGSMSWALRNNMGSASSIPSKMRL